MGTCKFGGKYGSICGQIWVPDHDSKFAPLQAEIPLLETVGGCPNPLLSKDLKNPSQSKTKIRNWTKKTSITGKTHNVQKKCPYGFPGIYIYISLSIYLFNDLSIYIFIHWSIFIFISIYLSIYLLICLFFRFRFICVSIVIFIFISIHIHSHIHVYIYIFVYMYVYICIYSCAYVLTEWSIYVFSMYSLVFIYAFIVTFIPRFITMYIHIYKYIHIWSYMYMYMYNIRICIGLFCV